MALHPEGVSSTEFFTRLAAHSVVASEATQNEKQDRSKTSSIMMVQLVRADNTELKSRIVINYWFRYLSGLDSVVEHGSTKRRRTSAAGAR